MIAGELAGAGQARSACWRWAATTTSRDFDQLELSAYQRLYLNGGPVPDRRGPGRRSSPAPTLGGGTVVNWTNCLRTHPWVREEWAREHGLEGLDGPEFDRHLDAVSARLGRQRRLLRPEPGPHQRLREGCERLGYDFRPITPQRRPRRLRPGERRLHGLRRPVGLQALDREDLPARRAADRRADSSPTAAPSGSWSRAGAPPGSRPPGSTPSRQRRTAPEPRVVVRAPTVVVACGSIESPALLLALRASAARRPATTCACTRPRR